MFGTGFQERHYHADRGSRAAVCQMKTSCSAHSYQSPSLSHVWKTWWENGRCGCGGRCRCGPGRRGGEVGLALRVYSLGSPWEKKSAANNGGRLTLIVQTYASCQKTWSSGKSQRYNTGAEFRLKLIPRKLQKIQRRYSNIELEFLPKKKTRLSSGPDNLFIVKNWHSGNEIYRFLINKIF